jgi:predicted nucleic-acid-binding protein
MRAVDTNILVRLLVNDDQAQAEAAQSAMAAEPAFILKTVMIELEWVLRSAYERSRAETATSIESLLAAAGVIVEDSAAVEQAVVWFRQGMDFADALHLASSGHVDAFVTFDVDLCRQAARLNVKPPVVSP